MELVEVFRSAMVDLVVESADQELVILEKILLSPHSMRAVAHRPTIRLLQIPVLVEVLVAMAISEALELLTEWIAMLEGVKLVAVAGPGVPVTELTAV
jgi:hypothetical protein